MGCCGGDSSSMNDNSRRELELTAMESKSNDKRKLMSIQSLLNVSFIIINIGRMVSKVSVCSVAPSN